MLNRKATIVLLIVILIDKVQMNEYFPEPKPSG